MLREQEKELRETEEKRTRLVKEVWTVWFSYATKFRTFRQKYEIYEIKSGTNICAITVDGSDVTIVALKLAMNLHFPLPKIRTIFFFLPVYILQGWPDS